MGSEAGKALTAYIPGGLERSFEEFAQLHTEQGEDRLKDPQSIDGEVVLDARCFLSFNPGDEELREALERLPGDYLLP